MNIFIAKLSSRTDDDSLRTLFEPFGEIRSAKVIMDRETGFSKKFGFVEMDNDDEANMAIEQLNETDFEGSTIVVKKARPKEDNRGTVVATEMAAEEMTVDIAKTTTIAATMIIAAEGISLTTITQITRPFI